MLTRQAKAVEIPEHLPFTITPVFDWNSWSHARVTVNQGGSQSSKTVSVLQVLWCKLMDNPGWICTVTAEDIPQLKKGPIRDWQDRIQAPSQAVQDSIASYNATERLISFRNGSKLEFDSYANEQDAKNGKRDLLFVNEANGVMLPVYRQLAMRTSSQIFVDFNPTNQFWAHEELVGQRVKWLYSNYTHNPYCPAEARIEIESYRKSSPMDWLVYGLGKTGNVQGLVFREVEYVDAIPLHARNHRQGLDFGFTNDPTVVVRTAEADGYLYGEQLVYAKGLTMPLLSDEMDQAGVSRREELWCDSASPVLIAELVELGWNAVGAPKGQGSVNAGIVMLKAYKGIRLTTSSTEWRKEQRNYKWQTDRRTGKATNKPVDTWNHAWDAARYCEVGFKYGSTMPEIIY